MFFIDIVVCTYPWSHVQDQKKFWKIVEFWIFVNLLSGISRVILRHLLPPISLINTRVAQVLLRPTTCWIFSITLIYDPLSPIPWLPGVNKMLANIKQSCLGGGVWRWGGPSSNLLQMNCRISVYCFEWRVVECLVRRSVPTTFASHCRYVSERNES